VWSGVKCRVVVIQSSGGLSKEQVEQMVNEAQEFAESDKKKKVKTAVERWDEIHASLHQCIMC